MFRALNEKKDDDSTRAQDGSFKKPTKEAQEEEAMDTYNQAMALFAQSKHAVAAQSFQDLLQGPYLNQVNLSPKQMQLRIGCYKNLSKIYSSMKEPDYEASKSFLLQAIKAEPNNTNLWYQLGQIGMLMIDFSLATSGFSQALRCAPGHWGCIEKLIGTSYITHDYIGCLHYCAMGIGKDESFIRGHIFRDIIFENHPFYKDLVQKRIENPEHLSVKYNGDYNFEEMKEKYLLEIDQLKSKEKKIILETKNYEEEERSRPFLNQTSTLTIKSLTALVQNLLLVNEAVKEYGTFLRPVILENEVGQCEKENEIKKDSSSTCNVDFNHSKSLNLHTSINGELQKESSTGIPIVPIDIVNNNDDYNQEEKPNDDVKNANETASRKKKFKKDCQNEGKRRSQRVKGIVSPLCNDLNEVKRKEEEEEFSDALKSIIHSSFIYGESSSEKDEDVDAEPFESNLSKVCEADNYFSSLNEEMDVKNFVQENTNDNIINIINNFLAFLCNERGELVWPEELAHGFIHLYHVYRSHTMLPDISYDKDLPAFTLDTRITLTFLELVVDNFFSEESVKNSFQVPVDTLHHLNEIIQANQDLVDYQNLIIRLYWAQSILLFTLEKKYGNSSNHQVIIEYLQASLELFKKFGLTSIKISTRKDNTLSLAEIVNKISCVEKFRNIDHVHDLYTNGKFAELIEILNYSQTSIHQVKNDQLKLVHQFYLAESYFQMNQYQEAINQCVQVLKFSLSNYQITSKCLSIIDSILQVYMGNMSLVEHKNITNQIVQVLITYAGKLVLGRSSLYTLPWCILHRIVSYYERTEPSVYLTTAEAEQDTPSSIKLLQFAHETLSSKNKCLIDDGSLLKYTIENVKDYFDFKETKQTVEQAIYCLYNHPHKKKKPRYLVEHGTSGLSCNLAWENCKDVYLYYKPDKLPEFDSFDHEFIGSDVANLYQRIFLLMPQVYKPTEGEIRAVLHFLDGKVDNIEGLNSEFRRDSSTTFPPDFQDIYYLIASYYWKTKEWEKVVEYSVSDLTFNPDRFDAFIFVAMAKCAVLSEQFRFCRDYKPEDVLETSGQIAKCYEKALSLDPGNSKIILEFGSFCYGVHSFCSRLTKQSSHELSMDKFTLIDSKEAEFLRKAKECFEHFHRSTTEEIYFDEDDEDIWFKHYMLGKIEEKLNLSDPAKYLSQYELAGSFLHQLDKNHKSCPKKISYSNPPEWAIETLEVYYRLHASILAYIERHDYCEEKEKLLAEFIDRASQTPFALGRSTDCDPKKSEKEDNGLIIKELLENILNRVVMDVETCSNYSLMEMESQNQNRSSSINSQSKLSQMSTNSNIEKYQSGSIQMNKTVLETFEGKFYQDFKDVKYGRLVAKCLQAFELCISRFPQHHKSYYRIAFTYSNMLKNYSMSRDYYFGRFQDPCNQERKIDGLFYDRKQNNIFNNVRRNPIEDIDRLGSFSYHMAKAIHQAIDILQHLQDYNLLNEIGELLSKEPELKQKYIYCNERQELRDWAFSLSKSIKKSLPTTNVGQAEENQFGCEQKQRQNINNNLQVQSSVTGPANNNPIPNSNISTKISSTRQISTDGTWMSNTSTSTTMADRNNTNSLNTRKEIPAQKTSLSFSRSKNNLTKPVSNKQDNDNKVVAKSRSENNIQNRVPTKTSISNINNYFNHKRKNLSSTTTSTSTTISAASNNSPYFSLKSPPRTQNNDSNSNEKNSPEMIDLTCKTPPKDPLEIETVPRDPLKIDTPPKYRLIIDTPVKRVPILDKRILELQKRAREREWTPVLYEKILKSLTPSMKTDDPKPLPNLIAIPGAANLSLLSRNKKNESPMKESFAGNLNKNNVERRVSLKRKVKASQESEESSLSPSKKKHLKLAKNIVSNSTISSSISHSSTLPTSSVSQNPGFIFQDPSNPEKFIIKPQIIIIDD